MAGATLIFSVCAFSTAPNASAKAHQDRLRANYRGH